MGCTFKIILFGSNVSVGFVVVSLSLGNPPLPAGDRAVGYIQLLRQLLLGQAKLSPALCNELSGQFAVHTGITSAVIIVAETGGKCNKCSVEA